MADTTVIPETSSSNGSEQDSNDHLILPKGEIKRADGAPLDETLRKKILTQLTFEKFLLATAPRLKDQGNKLYKGTKYIRSHDKHGSITATTPSDDILRTYTLPIDIDGTQIEIAVKLPYSILVFPASGPNSKDEYFLISDHGNKGINHGSQGHGKTGIKLTANDLGRPIILDETTDEYHNFLENNTNKVFVKTLNPEANQKEKKDFEKEIEIAWKAYPQQNLSGYTTLFQTRSKLAGNKAEVVTGVIPWLPGINGRKFLLKNSSRLSIADRISLLIKTISELDRIHNLGIAHLDIKPDNFMILENTTGNFEVHICDFGTAMQTGESLNAGTTIGTEDYMAPEIKLNYNTLDVNQLKLADCYSAGQMVCDFLGIEPLIQKLKLKRQALMFPQDPNGILSSDKYIITTSDGTRTPTNLETYLNNQIEKVLANNPPTKDNHPALQKLLTAKLYSLYTGLANPDPAFRVDLKETLLQLQEIQELLPLPNNTSSLDHDALNKKTKIVLATTNSKLAQGTNSLHRKKRELFITKIKMPFLRNLVQEGNLDFLVELEPTTLWNLEGHLTELFNGKTWELISKNIKQRLNDTFIPKDTTLLMEKLKIISKLIQEINGIGYKQITGKLLDEKLTEINLQQLQLGPQVIKELKKTMLLNSSTKNPKTRNLLEELFQDALSLESFEQKNLKIGGKDKRV